MTTEERITELEIRIAHLEAALQTISDELSAQQRRGNRLDDELRRMGERISALADAADGEPEPPPPHY